MIIGLLILLILSPLLPFVALFLFFRNPTCAAVFLVLLVMAGCCQVIESTTGQKSEDWIEAKVLMPPVEVIGSVVTNYQPYVIGACVALLIAGVALGILRPTGPATGARPRTPTP
jgi:hypothetical protein